MIHKDRIKALLLVVLFFGCIGLLCLFLYQPMMKVLQNGEEVKLLLEEHGIIGRMIIVSIMALQVIFIFLPGEIIEVLAGLLYGPFEGLILCLIGVLLGSLFIYMLVKRCGIWIVEKLIGIDKIQEISFLQNKRCFQIILFIIYFIPGTPKDILTYFIPLTKIPFLSFLLITTLARIPSIITSTISGNALGLKQYELSIGVFIITIVLSTLGLWSYKHYVKLAKNL